MKGGEQMKLENTIFITRPRIVQLLLEADIHCKRVPNPFNEKLNAWEVADTHESRAIVDEFYKALNGGEQR